MKVVKGTKEHLDQAASILTEAFFDSIEEAKEHLQEKMKEGTWFVAVEDEVLGVMAYNRDYSHYANYLSDIAVAKKHRRKGIASHLLEKFIEISKQEQPKKQRYALSSTDVTNTSSIALHEKCGFTNLGIIKSLHYGKDEIFFGFDLQQ